MIWLLRAKRWAQSRPSRRYVITVLVVLAAAGIITGLEALGLWPDWARAESNGRRIFY